MTDSASCARFSKALEDKNEFKHSHRTVYQSVTFWHTGKYLIEVTTGYFWSAELAKNFALNLKLVVDGSEHNFENDKYMRFVDSIGYAVDILGSDGDNYRWFHDDKVKIYSRKSSAAENSLEKIEDYEMQKIELEEFCNLMVGAKFSLCASHAKLVAQLPIQYA